MTTEKAQTATMTQAPAAPATRTGSRLLSLDVMRGMTIVGMIVVNNAGGPQSYDFLRHSVWNGLTPCDLVFPFFLFIMGVTTYLSLSKNNFAAGAATVRKILRRAVLIILIGWAIHWVELACKGNPLGFETLRLTGVLPRIGLCFGLTSLFALWLGPKRMPWIAGGLLVVYTVLVCAFNGYAQDETNFNAIVDRFLAGASHLYHKSPVDPEGIASTIPALAHTMIGFCCGAIIKSRSPLSERIARLSAVGFMILAAGFLLSEWLPLNKRIWSPTFALATAGLAALLLATLIYAIDMRDKRRWCTFFESFGVNPLFLYVLGELGSIAMSRSGAKKAVYECLSAWIPDPYVASAVYAVGFMLVLGAIGWPLYRRRIYIKI